MVSLLWEDPGIEHGKSMSFFKLLVTNNSADMAEYPLKEIYMNRVTGFRLVVRADGKSRDKIKSLG